MTEWVLVRPCRGQKKNGDYTKPHADNGCWYVLGSLPFLDAMSKSHDEIVPMHSLHMRLQQKLHEPRRQSMNFFAPSDMRKLGLDVRL